MSNAHGSTSAPPTWFGRARRVMVGLVVLGLGLLAMFVPLFAASVAPFVLGLLILWFGLVQCFEAFRMSDRRASNVALVRGGASLMSGALLMAMRRLLFAALAGLLRVTFAFDGLVAIVSGLRRRDQPDWHWGVVDGSVQVLLGLCIGLQWPVSGMWSIGLFVGIRILASGWTLLLGLQKSDQSQTAEVQGLHPDHRLELAPHPEVARLRELLTAEQASRWQVDRWWRGILLLTFFAVHVGRMNAEWNLIGLVSPAVATLGDACFALLLAFAVIIPARLVVRFWTRPLERRARHGMLARLGAGPGGGGRYPAGRRWVGSRMRFALQMSLARRSPTAAVGRGLQIGLPWIAVLVATNPIWGFSWYFNTENWATGFWEQWVEYRVDTWRTEMIQAVRKLSPEAAAVDSAFCQVHPEGVAAATDFSFLVIGDPGEGDASQHILRDQFLALANRHDPSVPDIRFVVIASDVIYPQGAMSDYEFKFYLPFKGIKQPIYAVPGNHDWYDALEAFTANFFEPQAARVALRARVAADGGLTSTTDQRIENLLAWAGRLRGAYGIDAGKQRSPYFEIQGERFALIVVDTGILRTVDDDQYRWLEAALERARGKFKMVIPGHPIYAGGRLQAEDEGFARLHRLLRAHQVQVVMAGDTHDFETYLEPYEAGGQKRFMRHFVNGGGGAYLSIGTALDVPSCPAVADWGHYPRRDAIVAKLDAQTPLWKQPLWFWVKRLKGWPSSPETLASAFDFNREPFFQSFMEVRVEGSANRVRFLLYGANGLLRWRDLQMFGAVKPAEASDDDPVQFDLPLGPPAAATRGPGPSPLRSPKSAP